MMLNRADECWRRADECRRSAAEVADDALRGTYLDLARRWRMMANQAESLEQKEEAKKQAGLAVNGEDAIRVSNGGSLSTLPLSRVGVEPPSRGPP
jgi:hypothetical protein